MNPRIKNWTRRMAWKAACWLAATQGVNLNRAIYVGSGAETLKWREPRFTSKIMGASCAYWFGEEGVETVFGEAS